MSTRYYLRGTSWLGILNTVLGCLFNRVLVRTMDTSSGQTLSWKWDKARNHPPEAHNA